MQAFGIEKLCCISYDTDYGNMTIGFNFFVFLSPHSFCVDLMLMKFDTG